MEWKPIETAPKEHGVRIIVSDERGFKCAIVEWLDSSRVDDDFVSGWYINDDHNDPIWYRAWHYMTHWMPLPNPPV